MVSFLTFWALFCAGVFGWIVVGGAVTGVLNAFTPPNQRSKNIRDRGFIANVLLWPLTFVLLGGRGAFVIAEQAAAMAEDHVLTLRDITKVPALPGEVVEGEVEMPQNGFGSPQSTSLRTR